MSWLENVPGVGGSKPVISVLRLHGVITPQARFSRGVDDAAIAPLVERAIAPRRLAAIAISINSPGGAPVQSRLMAERLRDAARKKKVPLLAFCEDVAASGGYMLACAADEIFADAASIVGSIGVISASFGFDQAIARLGVERRVTTAGEAKMRLDPFQPMKSEDAAWLEALQQRLHRQFIDFVRASRGDRLSQERADAIFSGDAFMGDEALELGLIDGVGRLRPTIEARFGEKARIEVVARRRGFLERLSPGVSGAAPLGLVGGAPGDGAEALARAATAGALAELETAACWSRYGL